MYYGMIIDNDEQSKTDKREFTLPKIPQYRRMLNTVNN